MTYVIGYGSETTVGMSSSGGNYMATIPSSDVTPGSMVRWYVVATDGSGNTHREPPFSSPDEPQYYGTVVEDTGDNSTLPIIDL